MRDTRFYENRKNGKQRFFRNRVHVTPNGEVDAKGLDDIELCVFGLLLQKNKLFHLPVVEAIARRLDLKVVTVTEIEESISDRRMPCHWLDFQNGLPSYIPSQFSGEGYPIVHFRRVALEVEYQELPLEMEGTTRSKLDDELLKLLLPPYSQMCTAKHYTDFEWYFRVWNYATLELAKRLYYQPVILAPSEQIPAKVGKYNEHHLHRVKYLGVLDCSRYIPPTTPGN